jgi:hypothetical protein
VQPVLHRYNDAKYIWSDTSAREWLDGFVRAHDPTVPQAERRVVVGARARGALDGAHGPAPMRRIVIDLWSWKKVRRPRGPSCCSTRHALVIERRRRPVRVRASLA